MTTASADIANEPYWSNPIRAEKPRASTQYQRIASLADSAADLESQLA
jgi:hypothetical protein